MGVACYVVVVALVGIGGKRSLALALLTGIGNEPAGHAEPVKRAPRRTRAELPSELPGRLVFVRRS